MFEKAKKDFYVTSFRRPKPGPEILSSKQGPAKGKSPSRKMCDLTIVADHLFYEEIGEGSLEKTVLQMLWHVKEANAVFQSKEKLIYYFKKSFSFITV
jgi:hypothetical protein